VIAGHAHANRRIVAEPFQRDFVRLTISVEVGDPRESSGSGRKGNEPRRASQRLPCAGAIRHTTAARIHT